MARKWSKHHVRKYESVPDFINACEKRARKDGASWRGESSFCETKDFPAAISLAKGGWSAARPSVDVILEPLRERLAEVLDVTVEQWHDIIGSEPDIDRFVAGEFECMWDDIHIPTPTNGKVFTLLLSNAVNCNVSTKTILARGAAVAALIEAFQILGCELEIWIETSTESGYGWGGDSSAECYSTLVRAHAAGENLDINNLMFPVGHPSWLRRLWFAHCEGEPEAIVSKFGFVRGGYGHAFDEPQCDEMVGASIVLAMGANQNWDDKDTVGWILRQLEMQGVWTPPEGDDGDGV